jgi:hypothetical protein
MSRRIELQPHLTTDELFQRYRALQDQLREGRQHFQALLSQLRLTLRGLDYE